MLVNIERAQENAAARVRQDGPGSELVLQNEWKRLKADMDAFYSHPGLADVVALRAALRIREEVGGPRGSASLVDALLVFFDVQQAPLPGCRCTNQR